MLEILNKNYNKIIIFIIIVIVVMFGYFGFRDFNDKEVNNIGSSTNKDKLMGMDSDGDSINDYDEINVYKTDPNNNDTDLDGVLDNIEIELGTDNNNEDTDGDGLLDGKAQYVNGKMIAPVDPDPLNKNGLDGVWKKQIEIENRKKIPTYLTKFYEYNIEKNIVEKINDIDWERLLKSENIFEEILNLPLLHEIASKVLMFRLDNYGTVLHSQTNEDIYNYLMSEAKNNLPSDKYLIFKNAVKYLGIEEKLETWQKKFGFNSLYDEVFRIATNNNMRSAQLYFNDAAGFDYVLWLWRGDYLALGSGAEMGLYKRNTSSGKLTDLNLEHWDAIDFEVPMTLSLYNYYNKNNIEHIFSWAPLNNQWWITGFNTKFPNVDVTKHVIIGTVNFSKHKDMYNSLKEKTLNKNFINQFVIFDDSTATVWINWYEI